MTSIEISDEGTVIDGVRLASQLVEHNVRSDEDEWVLAGQHPQVAEDAERLREDFGLNVRIAPAVGYGSTSDMQIHTTAGGDQWMACPVCGSMIEGVAQKRGTVIRHLTDPDEQRMAALGATGGFHSERETVIDYRFTFSPCGDTFVAAVPR